MNRAYVTLIIPSLLNQKERSVHGEYGWLDRKKGKILNLVCIVSRSLTIRLISIEIARTWYRYGGAPTPNRGSTISLLFAEAIEMRRNRCVLCGSTSRIVSASTSRISLRDGFFGNLRDVATIGGMAPDFKVVASSRESQRFRDRQHTIFLHGENCRVMIARATCH